MTSPVTTTLEPKPSRVRNICICSGLVFCASSRMMNESFSVRPRMNASGATSIIPFSIVGGEAIGVEHVVERVEQRPQVRIDLREQVAREEAELLTRFDRRPREDDPADLALRQRGHGERHREVGLAGPRGADAERDRAAANRVDVVLLVDRLRGDLLAAMEPDHVLEDIPDVRRFLQGPEHRVDRARPDRVPRLDEVDQLTDDRPSARDVIVGALQGEPVAPQEHRAAEAVAQRLENAVVDCRQLGRYLVRDRENLLQLTQCSQLRPADPSGRPAPPAAPATRRSLLGGRPG